MQETLRALPDIAVGRGVIAVRSRTKSGKPFTKDDLDTLELSIAWLITRILGDTDLSTAQSDLDAWPERLVLPGSNDKVSPDAEYMASWVMSTIKTLAEVAQYLPE